MSSNDRGYWAVITYIDVEKGAMNLKSNKGKLIRDFKWDEWRSIIPPEEVKKLIDRDKVVRVFVTYTSDHTGERRKIVEKIYAINRAKFIEEKRKLKEDIMLISPTRIYIGHRPLSSEDRVWLETMKDGRGWNWRARLWVVDYRSTKVGEPLKIVLREIQGKGGYARKVDAVSDAVFSMVNEIKENVLGRDLSGFYPEEDRISKEGRAWLEALGRVYSRYTGRKLRYRDLPAKIRFVGSMKLNDLQIFLNSYGNVIYAEGNIANFPNLEEIYTGKLVKFRFKVNPNRMFVNLGGNIYSTYHLSAIYEHITGRRVLSVSGKYLSSAVGKDIVLYALKTKGDYAVIPVDLNAGRYILLYSLGGVEPKKAISTEVVEERDYDISAGAEEEYEMEVM